MPGSQRRGARGPGGGRCAGPVGAWPRGVYRGAGGVRSSGGPGGCGSRHPGTREPAWVSLALGEPGASFGKLPGRVSPWGTGSGFGVCVFSTASLLDPRLGGKEEAARESLPKAGRRTARACASCCLALNPRACGILFWNLASVFPGCPAPKLGGQFRAIEGPGLWMSGRVE